MNVYIAIITVVECQCADWNICLLCHSFNRQNVPIKHNKKSQNNSHQVPTPSFGTKVSSSGSFSATKFRRSNKTRWWWHLGIEICRSWHPMWSVFCDVLFYPVIAFVVFFSKNMECKKLHGVGNEKYDYKYRQGIIIFKYWTMYNSFSFIVANNFDCLDSSGYSFLPVPPCVWTTSTKKYYLFTS
jgi:hypothetical protein